MFMPATVQRETDSVKRFEDLLARAGVKDRANIEKHLAACEAEPNPAHAQLWRRMVGKLGALSPLPPQTQGQGVLLFFVPDGKYRMQVFALEDRRDGNMQIYLPNVMPQALREKVLHKSGDHYSPAEAPTKPIDIMAMDAANTTNPPAHVKNMIGWNRKALMITLNVSEANSPQVNAAESLCALAAKQWAGKTAS
jgi:hypothetical protein